jgi:glycosyltransferase involved in cell wall biosynthesis
VCYWVQAVNNNKLNMLFLALQAPGFSPGQRFRVESYLSYLLENGIETEYAWTLAESDLRSFYGTAGVSEKAIVALQAFARRAWSVRLRRRKPDVVLVQREAFFIGGDWAEAIASHSTPLVFDFDDAIWLHQISDANRRFAFLKNTEKFAHIVRRAHTVIAGNAWLADWAEQYNERVEIVPTCVDTARYHPSPRREDGTVVIGWSGSASTVDHLRQALPALRRVKARFGKRIRFSVMGDASFRDEDLCLQGEAWDSRHEVAALQAMDIGIMPLPDDEWSKGKCGFKGLTYMSVGIPAVMSPVGVNTEIVQDGMNGFTPLTEDDWVERLSLLVEDATLRRQLGAAGRRTVEQHYSVARWRGSFLDILRRAAVGRLNT